MAIQERSWFAVSLPGHKSLRCAACGKEIDLAFPSLVHHPSWCPACGAECVFFSCKDVLVQILPGAAPAELTRTLRWAQDNLDELEFVTVLASLTQVADAVRAGVEAVPQP
jgi:hypothetical protein